MSSAVDPTADTAALPTEVSSGVSFLAMAAVCSCACLSNPPTRYCAPISPAPANLASGKGTFINPEAIEPIAAPAAGTANAPAEPPAICEAQSVNLPLPEITSLKLVLPRSEGFDISARAAAWASGDP